MALITCRDLCLAYEGDPAVIENLNIEVKEGDYLCILGENGSGKSTLLNALLNQKIAIISPKPQTTRNAIRGIRTDEDSQIVFVDTPGIHKPLNKLGKVKIIEDKYFLTEYYNAEKNIASKVYDLTNKKVITPNDLLGVSYIKTIIENKKAKTETFVNKAARIYTPIVLILAILVATSMSLLAPVDISSNTNFSAALPPSKAINFSCISVLEI